jgi:hypothetical protein
MGGRLKEATEYNFRNAMLSGGIAYSIICNKSIIGGEISEKQY